MTDAEKQIIALGNQHRSDRQNNERWAYNMQKYWHDLGHTNVKCVAIESTHHFKDKDGQSHASIHWGIKSNLVGGLPPTTTPL